MGLLRKLLEDKGVQAVEAGGALAPGQNAFCAKICSKIITSQFCAVLLNNDTTGNGERPNANVNMEYGLMLGFNKYVIPFQREHQSLPFNVAGFDTVKYTNTTFEAKASAALDIAIKATTQDAPTPLGHDQILEAYLLANRLLLVALNEPGDRTLYEIGRPLGFNLLMTFDGMSYRYLGNFTALRPEIIVWRIRTLDSIFRQRLGSMARRIELGIVDAAAAALFEHLVEDLEILIAATSIEDRDAVTAALAASPLRTTVRVLSLSDIETALRTLG
jgi:hypothetical protein